jgi:hypothetical protein
MQSQVDLNADGSDFLQYPLNTFGQDCDAHNFRLYRYELEQRTSNLFVESPKDCSVELWQTDREAPRGEPSAFP